MSSRTRTARHPSRFVRPSAVTRTSLGRERLDAAHRLADRAPERDSSRARAAQPGRLTRPRGRGRGAAPRAPRSARPRSGAQSSAGHAGAVHALLRFSSVATAASSPAWRSSCRYRRERSPPRAACRAAPPIAAPPGPSERARSSSPSCASATGGHVLPRETSGSSVRLGRARARRPAAPWMSPGLTSAMRARASGSPPCPGHRPAGARPRSPRALLEGPLPLHAGEDRHRCRDRRMAGARGWPRFSDASASAPSALLARDRVHARSARMARRPAVAVVRARRAPARRAR